VRDIAPDEVPLDLDLEARAARMEEVSDTGVGQGGAGHGRRSVGVTGLEGEQQGPFEASQYAEDPLV
jgi:hypothetical protein